MRDHMRVGYRQDVLVLVLAGGRGERLFPLTRDRTKGAVPFGGQYRLIDFTLSSCVNSGLRRIYVLPQCKFASLERHLRHTWSFLRPELDEILAVSPPQHSDNGRWYLGTADAVFQNIHTLRQEAAASTLILASDHVYRMDYRLLLEHHRSSGADLTIACKGVEADEARRLGILQVNSGGFVDQFDEKPENPVPMPQCPDRYLASMGIYAFDTDALIDALVADATRPDSTHDFGHDLIPRMLRDGRRVSAYDASTQSGADQFYWRDIGTLDAYWQASMDLLAQPSVLELSPPDWPLYARPSSMPPARIGDSGCGAERIADSFLCPGAKVDAADVRRSILSPGVSIGAGAWVVESVLMDGVQVGPGAQIHRAIVDKDVVVPAGFFVGADPEDAPAYMVTASGLAVLPKGWQLPATRSGVDSLRIRQEDLAAAQTLVLAEGVRAPP